MSIVFKAMGLLEALSPEDIERLSPFSRRRFAEQCRRIAAIVDAPPPPKVGVLASLKDGERAH